MAREYSPMKSASSPPLPIGSRPTRRGPTGRSLAIVVGIGVALAALSLGVAQLLNDPTGPRPVVAENPNDPSARPDPSDLEGLPPFSTLLERPFPGDLASAQPETAAEGLKKRLEEQRTPERLVDLGVAYQRLGTPDRAVPFFREALELDPEFVPARVGLVMAESGTGPDAPRTALRELRAIERELPRNQMVVFNVAWAAFYALDEAETIRAFRRVVALDDTSYLGVTAEGLLTAGGVSSSPTGP